MAHRIARLSPSPIARDDDHDDEEDDHDSRLLLDILTLHRQPVNLTYDAGGSSTTVVSDSVVNQMPRAHLISSPQLLHVVHTTLSTHAAFLAPSAVPRPGRLGPSAEDTDGLKELLRTSSASAALAATHQVISGELGQSHFVMAYLIAPLNEHLRLSFGGTGLVVYWRFVGGGPGGHADIELVWDRTGPRQPDRHRPLNHRELVKLAVIEIQTDSALPDPLLDNLADTVRTVNSTFRWWITRWSIGFTKMFLVHRGPSDARSCSR